MIAKDERKELKKAIGHTYAKKVLLFFDANEIKTAQGEPYSENYIRLVMNGAEESATVETGLFRAATHYKEENELGAQHRKNFMQNV